MEISPYLVFDGSCAEAFAFYATVLSGAIVSKQTFGESPAKDHVPPAWADKLIHVRLTVGSEVLMGSDAPPPQFSRPQGTSVSITVATPVDAERIFTALAESGTITMPFGKTFWSPGFGMAVDRFGTPWIVNSEPT